MRWTWTKILAFVAVIAGADYFLEWAPPAKACRTKGGHYTLDGACTKISFTPIP